MLATKPISAVQTHAMPNMTLPATIWAGSVPRTNSRMHHTHAARAATTTMPINVAACPTEKPSGLIENEASAELCGINPNRDDDVAAVETQTVIKPRPQTTCPVINEPAMCEVRMKMPHTNVARANE